MITNADIQSIREDVRKKELGFIRVIIMFKSPVTEEIEHRVAYFTDTMEADLWKNSVLSEYRNAYGIEAVFDRAYVCP